MLIICPHIALTTVTTTVLATVLQLLTVAAFMIVYCLTFSAA
jgi:hypothetical protein